MNINEAFAKKGLVSGPLNFPCTPEVADELEQDIKHAEQDGLIYTRTVASKAVSELVEGERADISVITDATLDRDNEVVMPGGLDVKHFRNNPIVAWMHDYTAPPVGKAMWIKTSVHGDKITAKTLYASRPENFEGTFFPDTVWALVKQGMLPAKSIGFMPTESRGPTQKEVDARPELASAKRIIVAGKLFEYSCVGVPCNPNALAEAVAKGLEVPPHLIELLGIHPIEAKAIVEEVAQEIVKTCVVWTQPEPQPSEPAFAMPKVCQPIDEQLVARIHELARRINKRKKINPDQIADEVVRKMLGRL